jgi:hypothetical protein
MKRPNASTVTAAAATITAVAALAVAVWDNVQSRAYNRLSVRPLLVLDAERNTTEAIDRGELTISNQGVGPAIVRQVRIRYVPIPGGSDSTVSPGDTLEFEAWAELAARLREFGFLVTGWADLATDRPIGTDHSIQLFRFQIDRNDTPGAGADVQDVFDAVTLDVEYESVYGERFSTDTDLD